MIQISLAIFKHFQICLNFNKNRCTNSCVIDRHHVCAICIKNYIAFHCFLIKQFDFWLLYHLIIYFNNNLSKIHLNINFHISFKIYFNMNLFFEIYSNIDIYSSSRLISMKIYLSKFIQTSIFIFLSIF